MRQTPKVEGTKIAQAAKDLNVTSVTIRRYLTEFNIETATDENGIKVLPRQAMEELKMVRSLKEDGLTNPKVMELLEANRAEGPKEPSSKGKDSARTPKSKAANDEAEAPPESRKGGKRHKEEEPEEGEKLEAEAEAEEDAPESKSAEEAEGDAGADQKPKHSLTCQTCGKVFEHMNPRLRDCLDCYRTKRKERRRGGSDRHKNVIQHPIAQQVVSKAAHQNQHASIAQASYENGDAVVALPSIPVAPVVSPQPSNGGAVSSGALQRGQVRNYRKAIEETRQITGSLKRRLERPDLPEGDRRWLEQIYAYQLILHQGWRHLSDYKNNTQTPKQDE